MSEMVSVLSLCKKFSGISAVDNVSFTVERGEVLGFLGPNGAGKSTTMKMITGFLLPDSGSVRINGVDIQQQPLAAKRKIGYLPEGVPLYADMTPLAFLDFTAEARGIRGNKKIAAIESVIERINLTAVLDQSIDTLSKGFKRRVGLAQAILHDPEVLILDEPTDGLDPNQKHEVRKLIQAMASEKAIILSTHILEEVESVCSRAVVIAAGKVVADDSPSGLAAKSPLHNAVVVHISGGDFQTAMNQLAAIEGVSRVESLSSPAEDVEMVCRLYPQSGCEISGAVAETLRSGDWKINQLKAEQVRLDDVFRDLTLPKQALS